MRHVGSLLQRTIFLVLIRAHIRNLGFQTRWKLSFFRTSWNEGEIFGRVASVLEASLPIDLLWSTVATPLSATPTFQVAEALASASALENLADRKADKHRNKLERLQNSGPNYRETFGALLAPLSKPANFMILDGRHRASLAYFHPETRDGLIKCFIIVRRQDLKFMKAWRKVAHR